MLLQVLKRALIEFDIPNRVATYLHIVTHLRREYFDSSQSSMAPQVVGQVRVVSTVVQWSQLLSLHTRQQRQLQYLLLSCIKLKVPIRIKWILQLSYSRTPWSLWVKQTNWVSKINVDLSIVNFQLQRRNNLPMKDKRLVLTFALLWGSTVIVGHS